MVVLVVLASLLLVVEVVLLARVVADWTTLLAGVPARASVRERATRGVVSVTEPVLAPVRRVVPPLRIGRVSLDLSLVLVFLAVIVARALLLALAGV